MTVEEQLHVFCETEPHPKSQNIRDLSARLEASLLKLVLECSTESEIARRQEIRRVKQAHYFWRGLHYLWWSERDQNWHLPFEQKLTDQTSLEEMPRYEFVTNIYQAFGQSIVAVLSQSVPSVRFLPKSPSSEIDIATAKAATDISEVIERNNRIEQRVAEEAFHLWVGGKVGAYVRYVVDGQAFGYHPEPTVEMRQKQVRPAGYLCPGCSARVSGERAVRVQIPGTDRPGLGGAEAKESSPESDNREQDYQGIKSTAENSGVKGPLSVNQSVNQGEEKANRVARSAGDQQVAPRGGAGELVFCPECGAKLAGENWEPAEAISVPEVIGSEEVANGEEMITIVGALELKTPPWASEQREFPYLQWNMETHIAKLRAAYPWAADKIGAPVVPDASAQYERLARLSQSQGGPFTQGGDYNQNLITYQRTWLRPWTYYMVEDKAVRQQLFDLFPEGCYVAFAGDTYLESRNESMDDRWRVMHAMLGDGSSTGRPALGDSLISVQERFNTLTNLQMETYDYGVPPVYIDPEAIDLDATTYQSAEPGATYPARPRPGQPLAASFYSPAPAQVPPDLVQHAAELMGPIAQFLTGAFPALFGGAMENQKTATGYAMARDQAMGRLGLVWRRMRQFHADVMLLAVDCFRKNRSEDVEIPVVGEGIEFEAKWIRLADLKGNLLAYPEADEQFPEQWNAKRAILLQLAGMNDPVIQQTLALPENLTLVKQLLGLTELKVPGEDSRTKQMREIAVLLQGEPVPQSPIPAPTTQPGTAVPLPQGGMPPGPRAGDQQVAPTPPPPQPTVMPDEFADDHGTELQTAKDWLNSDAGQAAKLKNPGGWANVRAHAMLHQQYLQQQQQQAAQAQVALQQAAKAKPPAPSKGPSESINFKDLPPEGQEQMAHQAGIELEPVQRFRSLPLASR